MVQTSPPFLARARQQPPRLRVLLIFITRVRPEIAFPPIPLRRRRIPIIAPRPPATLPRLVLIFVYSRWRGRERRLQRHPHRLAAHRTTCGACTRSRHRRRARVRFVLPWYSQRGRRRCRHWLLVKRLANGTERCGRPAVAPLVIIGILPTLRACGGRRFYDDAWWGRRYHDRFRRGGRGRVVPQGAA